MNNRCVECGKPFPDDDPAVNMVCRNCDYDQVYDTFLRYSHVLSEIRGMAVQAQREPYIAGFYIKRIQEKVEGALHIPHEDIKPI